MRPELLPSSAGTDIAILLPRLVAPPPTADGCETESNPNPVEEVAAVAEEVVAEEAPAEVVVEETAPEEAEEAAPEAPATEESTEEKGEDA